GAPSAEARVDRHSRPGPPPPSIPPPEQGAPRPDSLPRLRDPAEIAPRLSHDELRIASCSQVIGVRLLESLACLFDSRFQRSGDHAVERDGLRLPQLHLGKPWPIAEGASQRRGILPQFAQSLPLPEGNLGRPQLEAGIELQGEVRRGTEPIERLERRAVEIGAGVVSRLSVRPFPGSIEIPSGSIP